MGTNVKFSMLQKLCYVVNILVNALIACVFGYACLKSYLRYTDEMIGSSSKYEDQTDFAFPEVSICIWTHQKLPSEHEHNMTYRFEQLQKENFIVSFYQVIGDEMITTYGNSSGVPNFTITSQILENLWTVAGRYAFCTYYRTLQPSKVGFSHKLKVIVDFQNIGLLTLAVADQRSFLPSYTKKYGLDYVFVYANNLKQPEENKIQEVAHSFSRIQMEGIPTKHHECLERDPNLRACYHDFLKNVSGCYIPSANLTLKPLCETTDQESMVSKTNYELLEMGENDFAKKTGCIASCSFSQYKLADFADRELEKSQEGVILNYPGITVPSTAKRPVQLGLHTTESNVLVIKSYLLHDFTGFMSDVGSFMGLLLGFCAKYFTDLIYEQIMKLLQK